jgi:hypothetical protein
MKPKPWKTATVKDRLDALEEAIYNLTNEQIYSPFVDMNLMDQSIPDYENQELVTHKIGEA